MHKIGRPPQESLYTDQDDAEKILGMYDDEFDATQGKLSIVMIFNH